MVAKIVSILNILAAKQNQKFPFHFFVGCPHTPRRKLEKRKENFWVLPARVRERGRGAIRAYDSVQSHHALRACHISRDSARNGF
jgi:hypothetical protein